jgi:asparagine N-glycosylation enzyme membrane subunit Stt3
VRAGISVPLFLLALLIRAVGAPRLLEGTEGAYFFGNDAYYHVRRIWYAVVNFPDFLYHDSYLNYPHGAQAIWPPTFDWLSALLVYFTVGPESQNDMERLLVWVPPALGAATVVALYRLAIRYFSRSAALVAGLILAVLPGHFWYSQFGFVDHHVAVALVTTGLLAAAMALSSHEPGGIRLSGAAWRASAWLGVALAGSLLVWPGCLIHVSIIEVALLARLLSASPAGAALAWGRLFAAANAVAAAVVFPWSWGNEWELYGSFSPLVLSRFQPVGFAMAAFCFGAVTAFWQRRGVPARAVGRVLPVLLLGGLMLGMLLTLVPAASEGVAESWGWFAKRESFQAGVSESMALFLDGRTHPEQMFTRALYLAPLLLLVLGRRARRQSTRDPVWLFLLWCTALGAATLVQRRFGNSFSVAWALLLGWSLCEAARALATRLTTLPPARVIAAGLALVAAAWVLQPVADFYGRYLRNVPRILRGEPARPVYKVERLNLLREATASWLGANSPTTAGWLDPAVQPEYSVLAPWSGGHLFRYVARRPMVWDSFGDDVARENFAAAGAYFAATSEDQALEQLEGLRVRYVIARRDKIARTPPGKGPSMAARLGLFRGSEKRVGERGPVGLPTRAAALGRHRLIYASVPLAGRPEAEPAHYQVFEIVAGARVQGNARPGAVVRAELEVRPLRGAPFRFVTATRADPQGRYELRLPYPNQPFSTAVQVGKRYEVASGPTRLSLRVLEAAVRSGATLEGPSFGE